MFKKYGKLSLAILLVCTTVFLSACGGDDAGGSSSVGSSSGAESYLGLIGHGPNEAGESTTVQEGEQPQTSTAEGSSSGTPSSASSVFTSTTSSLPNNTPFPLSNRPNSHVVGTTGEFSKYAVMSMPGESCIAFKNEAGKITVSFNSAARAKITKGVIKFTLTSIYDDVIRKEISFNENTSAEVSFAVDTSKLGYWAVQAELFDDGKLRGTATGVYSIVNKPQSYDKFEPDNFFGAMGIWGDGLAANRIGIKNDRPCLYWRFIQRADKSYDWGGFDELIETHMKNKINVNLMIQPEIFIFDQKLPGHTITSAWDIMTNATLQAEYRKFVEAIVRRYVLDNKYKGLVNSIEIINEPDLNLTTELGWGDLTRKQAGEVSAWYMREGYAIIKALAPNMPVLGMSVSERRYFSGTAERPSLTDWMFEANKSTGKKMLDVASLHPYPQPWSVSSKRNTYATPEQFNLHSLIDNGIQYFKKNGINKIEITEVGYAVIHRETMLSYSRKLHAALVPRTLIISKSFPEISRVMYFCFNGYTVDDDYGGGALAPDEVGDDMTLVSGDHNASEGETHPYAVAGTFAQCAYMLNNTKPTKTISTGNGTISAYQFQSPQKTIVASWYDDRTKTITIKDIPSLEIYDMYGNLVSKGDSVVTLSPCLLYFVANVSESAKLAKAFE